MGGEEEEVLRSDDVHPLHGVAPGNPHAQHLAVVLLHLLSQFHSTHIHHLHVGICMGQRDRQTDRDTGHEMAVVAMVICCYRLLE